MTRANRHHLPGYIWHITHRCHKKEFLLKFEKDKNRWIKWLFEAKKRFGLEILNYTVTSNHIHLLVHDTKEKSIPRSIQLIAGRTGREYNSRKNRKGAFWEDRYHATAVKADRHLVQCLIYIDLNMVRAGVVQHPAEWMYGGYNEIQNPKKRYSLIDRNSLAGLLGMKDDTQLIESHRHWVEEMMKSGLSKREAKWSESIAVGDKKFVSEIKSRLGIRAIGRRLYADKEDFELHENQNPYIPLYGPEKWPLSAKNTFIWADKIGSTVY